MRASLLHGWNLPHHQRTPTPHAQNAYAPINLRAIDERGEPPRPNTEIVTHGREAEDYVQVRTHAPPKEVAHRLPGVNNSRGLGRGSKSLENRIKFLLRKELRDKPGRQKLIYVDKEALFRYLRARVNETIIASVHADASARPAGP